MSTKLTLESVLADFQLWRQTKSSPRNRIPDDLKQKAVALLVDLSAGKITRTLGISHAMLKSWNDQPTPLSDTSSSIEFVALSVAPDVAVHQDDHLILDFTQPNGNHWRLQGKISGSQLTAFVRTVGALSGDAP